MIIIFNIYNYAHEIEEYKVKNGIDSQAIALLALANDKMQNVNVMPFDPDWDLLSALTIQGFGFETVPLAKKEEDKKIIGTAHCLSLQRLKLQGKSLEVYWQTKGISADDLEQFLKMLNAFEACINEEFSEKVAKDLNYFCGLKSLSGGCAWFAHERFWAVAGVITPNTPSVLRQSYDELARPNVSGMEFLNHLVDKLNFAITDTSNADKVKNLIDISQQILLVIAAGVPEADAAYQRLCPANEADWQNIRKALFLALSVTEQPVKGGRTFLSTIYDLGRFYHEKTDSDQVKEYYWRLEAYGHVFSTLWDGLVNTKTDAQINADLNAKLKLFEDPLYRLLSCNMNPCSGKTEQRCAATQPIYKRAYSLAFNSTNAGIARSELTPSLQKCKDLNYLQAFRELFPNHTAWAEYNIPGEMVAGIVGDSAREIVLPAGFSIEDLRFEYAGGKWNFKALNAGVSQTIWQQGANTAEEFIGKLQNARGLHLFKFNVNANTLIINGISTGYMIGIKANGANVIVANKANDLGFFQSTAFARDFDNWADEGDNAINIEAQSFNAQRGVINAPRSSFFAQAPSVSLGSKKAVRKTHTNGHEYDFFEPNGQGIGANKFVTIISDGIDVAGASLFCRQMVQVMNPGDGCLWSQAAVFNAPYLVFSSPDWHTDTAVTFAGIPNVDPYQEANLTGNMPEFNRRQAAMVVNHAPTALSYQRNLHYFPGGIFVLNGAEFTSLFQGVQAYGSYGWSKNTLPSFTSYTTVTVVQPSGGGGGRGRGGYGGMEGFGNSFGGGFGGGSFTGSTLASMAASSVQLTGAEFSLSNRGGNFNVGGNITLSSMLGSTTMGFGASHGGQGSTTTLHSTFTPPSMHQAAAMIGQTGVDPHQVPVQQNPLLMLHGFNVQGIQLLTRPRDMNAQAALKLALPAIAILGGTYTASMGVDGTKKALDARDRQSGAAACGGMPDPDSDDEGERKVNCAKAESPVWKELRPYKGKFRIDAKGDNVYEWDHLHNDIEVYDKTTKNHLGSMDPKTGAIYKAAVRGRKANLP